MRGFLRKLRSPIFIEIVFTLAFCALVWFFGPLLGLGDWRPLESEFNRILVIVIVLTLLILVIGIGLWRRARRNRKVAEEIAGSDEPQDAAAAMAAEDLAEVRGRMTEALTLLRKSKLGGRKYLYQLPWYVIIGPPGAGKTTAIVNSGLQFPLADKMGKEAVGGVGGTRNCDWWFTNESVLIDTAGRYTTQDSDAEADQTAWRGFLGMLKRQRPRQPINGALVAISLSDISTLDEAGRRSHALAIRRRLSELYTELGVRFPIYILFTKADLIAGFSEFFEPLGREERQQVLGFTFPLDKRKSAEGPMLSFDAEFDGLLASLNERSLERVQQETDHQRRSLIFGFPQQMASLKTVARDFLNEIFQQNRFEDRQLLRGVYFSSGTQEGTPIDRLMVSMASTFGLGRQAIGTGQGSGRSFFLTRLLNDVIFGEAGLVSKDDRVERRYKWVLRGAAAAAAVVLAAGVTAWTLSYLGNEGLVAEADDEIARYQQLVAQIPVNPVQDTDLPKVVDPLNILRNLPGNPVLGEEETEPPLELTFGLYQGDAVGSEAAQAYRGALNQLLLPRLLLRLEEQMQVNVNNPDLLYEALKIYLILGQQGPKDEGLVKQYFQIDWQITYPGRGQEQLRADLAAHLDAMLAQPMKTIALNGPLVDQIQAIISETPIAERIYQSIIQAKEARDQRFWRLSEVGGPAISRAMIRPSGEPMTGGVEGIYTKAGFYAVMLPALLDVATQVQKESWVLGPRGEADLADGAVVLVSRDVLGLYYDDYVARWDRILGDLDVVPMESINHAVEVTNVLSGPNSPIVNILKSIADETQLTKQAGGALDVEGAAESVGGVVTDDISASFDVRTQALLSALTSAYQPGQDGAEPPPPPGQYVEDRFSWLHDLVFGADGGPPQLDAVIASMTEVYRELNRVSLAGNAGAAALSAAAGGGGAADRLKGEVGRLPGPMQRWAGQVAEGSSGIAAGGARAQLNAEWQAKVLPLCRKALSNRYPVNRKGRADVTIADFGRLFAPNGLIDGYFNNNLLPFVDTSTKPWKWRRTASNADLGISGGVLKQFERAADIRDSFFPGGAVPKVPFEMKPIELDSNATSVLVEIEGQKLEYGHGPIQVTPMSWPGQAGGRVRVAFQPAQAGSSNSMSKEGPWAFFRLLDAAQIQRSNLTDRFNVTFNVGGRYASFELRAGSVLNPFSLPALRSFRCPNSL